MYVNKMSKLNLFKIIFVFCCCFCFCTLFFSACLFKYIHFTYMLQYILLYTVQMEEDEENKSRPISFISFIPLKMY